MADFRGEKNPAWSGKLTDDDVREIKVALTDGARQADLARQYHVDRRTIQKIATGKRYGWMVITAVTMLLSSCQFLPDPLPPPIIVCPPGGCDQPEPAPPAPPTTPPCGAPGT